MIDFQIVKTLNTKNISLNCDETRRIVDELWNSTTKADKERAVEIGGYTDTRAFNKTRNTGSISVRMVITLAIALNIDPFYIIAYSKVKKECSDDNIKKFLKEQGFGSLVNTELERPTKAESVKYISQILDNITSEQRNAINMLSNEELKVLLDSVLIRSKVGGKEDIRLFLIKMLLTSF